jgi:hypothetical protein
MYQSARQNETQQQRRGGQQQGANQNGADEQRRGSSMHGNGYASQRGAEQTMNMAELAVRGTTLLMDIQMAALRNMWHLQARSAAAFGIPDCSDLLRSTENGAQRLFSTSAEQMLTSARQATDAISEMQTQFGRMVEQETQQLTEELQHGIEEVSQRTQESLQAVKQMAEQSLQQNGSGARRQQRNEIDEPEYEQSAVSRRGEQAESQQGEQANSGRQQRRGRGNKRH